MKPNIGLIHARDKTIKELESELLQIKAYWLWWSLIIVHHSWSVDHGTLDWPSIRLYHSSWRIDGHIVTKEEYLRRKAIKDGKLFQSKWFKDDPGYHAGCENYKGHPEVLYGLTMNLHGIHCKGKNDVSLGFCFVGNYDRVAPADTMLQYAASHWFAPLLVLAGYNVDIIKPHSEYANKSCPGKKFPMDKLKNMVSELV